MGKVEFVGLISALFHLCLYPDELLTEELYK